MGGARAPLSNSDNLICDSESCSIVLCRHLDRCRSLDLYKQPVVRHDPATEANRTECVATLTLLPTMHQHANTAFSTRVTWCSSYSRVWLGNF
eukprot:1671274-Amphidinium_carterae.1